MRFGRRTTQGRLQDVFSSAARYYLNNFRDGIKQDSIDLVAGHPLGDALHLQTTLIETVAFPGALVAIVVGAYFTSITARQCKASFSFKENRRK